MKNTLTISIFIVVNLFAMSKESKSNYTKRKGHYGTCTPVPGDCPMPEIGCFSGGEQCFVKDCECPSFSGYTTQLSSLSDTDKLAIAKRFAEKNMKDGMIDNENGKKELIEFVIQTINSSLK